MGADFTEETASANALRQEWSLHGRASGRKAGVWERRREGRPGCSRALEALGGFYPQSNGQPLECQKGWRLLEHSQEGQEVWKGVRAIFLLHRLPCGIVTSQSQNGHQSHQHLKQKIRVGGCCACKANGNQSLVQKPW